MIRVFIILTSLFLLGLTFSPQPELILHSDISSVQSSDYSTVISNGTVICTPHTEQYKLQFYVWNYTNTVPALSFNSYKLAQEIDGVFNTSAIKNGGQSRHIMFEVDEKCIPIVRQVEFTPTENLYEDLWNISSRLWTTSTKQIIFINGNDRLCGATFIYRDSSPNILENLNYRYPTGSFISKKCLNYLVSAHELVHNFGGIQPDAPNSSFGFHCYDNYDLMCERVQGIPVVCDGLENNILLDCGGDDYYTTRDFDELQRGTIPTQYIQNHLNIANSPYLQGTKYLKKMYFPMVN